MRQWAKKKCLGPWGARERERKRRCHWKGSERPIYVGEAGRRIWWGRAAGWLKAKSCPFCVWPMFVPPCPKW
jgi:hypothetical protein